MRHSSENTLSLGQHMVKNSRLFNRGRDLLAQADIQLNGDRPWDMQLRAPGVLEKAVTLGNLGLGEAYMHGHWDCQALDQFFYRILRHDIDNQVGGPMIWLHDLRARLLNLQTIKRAWHVGEAHYDLGNEFYRSMLDSRMAYTCGYWEQADNLEDAQLAKLEMICQKLRLEPGMKVLDIGCGWGSFMSYAATHYEVECVGVTISREQAAWAADHYHGLPLTFRLQDYRQTQGQFDRIVSIGMFEHVGHKNYRHYIQVASRCLKHNGLMLLHTIGKNQRHTPTDPWIDKYIFPNGELPALSQISDALEGLFVLEDLHNFGADYDKTLMAWHRNFEASWPQFRHTLGEKFYRMWRYYLLSCAGAFRARDIQLWQLVFSKKGIPGGYRRPC